MTIDDEEDDDLAGAPLYTKAQLIMREMIHFSPAVLRQMAKDVLLIPERSKPITANPNHLMQLRLVVAMMLESLAEDTEKVDAESTDG